MPRKPRKKSETGINHVIVRRIGQQGIFHDEDDFQRYLDTTKKLSLESGVCVQDYWLSIPHCLKGLDIDTEEPSPCVSAITFLGDVS